MQQGGGIVTTKGVPGGNRSMSGPLTGKPSMWASGFWLVYVATPPSPNFFSHPAVDYHQKYICHEMPTTISVALKGNGEVSVFGG